MLKRRNKLVEVEDNGEGDEESLEFW